MVVSSCLDAIYGTNGQMLAVNIPYMVGWGSCVFWGASGHVIRQPEGMAAPQWVTTYIKNASNLAIFECSPIFNIQ
jgi:hypothetical protein